MFWNDSTRWVATQLNAVCTYFPPPPRKEDDPKRKVLLVHCHPRADSFGKAIADAVEDGAKEGGHELRRRGLYEMKFQPVLSAAERGAYFDEVSPSARPRDVRQAVEDLRWCDSLVVVYPTWWFNMPALLKVRFTRSWAVAFAFEYGRIILCIDSWTPSEHSYVVSSNTHFPYWRGLSQGYFDRALVPGDDATWSFPDPDAGVLSGLKARLTNIDRIVGISTYGSGKVLGGMVPIAALAGDGGRTTLGMAVRDICTAPGSPCLLHWHALYSMDFTTEASRKTFLNQVKESIRDL